MQTICTASARLPASASPPPSSRDIRNWPLPEQGLVNRALVRFFALLAQRQVLGVTGIEHILPERDPFILAMNHSTRREVVLVPALLFLHRGGQLIHLLADWNFRLIPGLGPLYRRAQAVTVTRKSARPRILNLFKRLYRDSVPPLEQARALLMRGRSVGIFVEGTVNSDPDRLLAGRYGAARLSLETRAPVVPLGIRFPGLAPGERITDRAAMEIHVGGPLQPPARPSPALPSEVRAWHAAVMGEISRLSGKAWPPGRPTSQEIGNARR